jgi:thioredoxin 1
MPLRRAPSEIRACHEHNLCPVHGASPGCAILALSRLVRLSVYGEGMNWKQRLCVCTFVLLVAGRFGLIVQAQEASLSFPPFEQWRSAVEQGNAGFLRAMYSQFPAAQIKSPAGMVDANDEIAFWTGFKPKEMKLDVVESGLVQPGVEDVLLRAEIRAPGSQVRYFSEEQLWQLQNGMWRLLRARRTGPTRLVLPLSVTNRIYPAGDAREEIQHALAEAQKNHERLLIVFGADWCYDCHVLDAAFRRPDVVSVLRGNFEVVHVDVGEGDKNQDLMQQYQVPMKKGIPALAVVTSDGKLLYSQQNGEFENARALGPEDLLTFLNKWKPPR